MTRFKALLMATTLAGVVGAAALAPTAYAQVTDPAATAAVSTPAAPVAHRHGGMPAGASLPGVSFQVNAACRLETRIDQLSLRLGLTADQVPLFEDYRSAVLATATGLADACAAAAPEAGTVPDALTAMKNRLAVQTARVEALNATLPSFEALFNSLTDVQKALLTPMRPQGERMAPHARDRMPGGQQGGRHDGHGGNAGMPQGGRQDNRGDFMGNGGRNPGGFRHGGPMMPGAAAAPAMPQAAPVMPASPPVAPVPAA